MTLFRRVSEAYLALVFAAIGFSSVVPMLRAQAAYPNGLSKRLIGDYGYWSPGPESPLYSPAQIPFNELTHMKHAGISFDTSGNLMVPAGFRRARASHERVFRRRQGPIIARR